jgi:hypothetical protein
MDPSMFVAFFATVKLPASLFEYNFAEQCAGITLAQEWHKKQSNNSISDVA